MSDLIQELKQSFRSLLRDRAFTFFSVLALALGLGLNGSILVLSRNFLLQSAPVKNPKNLFEVMDIWSSSTPETERELKGSATAYMELKRLTLFQDVCLSNLRHQVFNHAADRHQEIQVLEATHEYLSLMGIRPYLGRFFEAGETGIGAPKPDITVIGHRFWITHLNGRPDVLGSRVSIDGKAHTVIGVLPKGFEGHGFNLGADLMVPYAFDRTFAPLDGNRHPVTVHARLKSGGSVQQARTALSALEWHKDARLELRPYSPMPSVLHRKLSRGLAGLHGAAFLILAIALANVFALQTARIGRKRHEWALRQALGASSRTIWRLVLLENLLLKLMAGGAAIWLAALANPLLEAIQAILPYPPKVHIAFNLWTGAMTLLASLFLGVLLSVFVHWQIRRIPLNQPLSEGRTMTGGTRLRGLLVGLQAALTLVLLTSAGLCLKDLKRQWDIPLGMDIQDRYLLQVQPEKRGKGHGDLMPLLPVLKRRLQDTHTIKAVALNQGGPLQGFSMKFSDLRGKASYFSACNAAFPTLMGMQLKEGRPFESSDEDQPRVLVSEAYAREHWPGESALGKVFNHPGKDYEVVGVLKGIRFEGPTSNRESFVLAAASLNDTVFSDGKRSLNNVTLRASGPAKAAKAAIDAAAKAELQGIPFELHRLEELRDEKLAQPRQLFFLSAVMGVLALLLSLSGLYGLSAHIAQSRQKELGLRVVLGATPMRILGVLGKGSLLPLVPGLTAGSLLAFGASKWLVSQNEGFSGLSVSVLLMTALILAFAAALATLVPAIKAMRQNPAEALKGD